MAIPVKIYTFPDHKNGDSFEGVGFTAIRNTVPINLTDAVIKMQLRTQKLAEVVALELSTTNNKIVITDAEAGKFQIPKDLIIHVEIPGAYFYDIQITESNGEIHTYVEGTWKILADVTR